MSCPNVLSRECIRCHDRWRGNGCVFSFCKKKLDVRLVRYHFKRYMSGLDSLNTYREWFNGYFCNYELL